MKKITKLLLFISALLLSLPTFGALAKPFKHTFSTVKGWDIRNGNVYHIEGDSVVITKGNGLFFKRIPGDPGREYEIKLTGSGSGKVSIGWDEVVFDDPFKESNQYHKKFRVPEDTRDRIMLRFQPKNDGTPFKITTVEFNPLPDPDGWVRHDRKDLLKNRPNPQIVRGMTSGTLDADKAKMMKDAYAKVVMIKFQNVDELASVNEQVDIALKTGLIPIVALNSNKDLETTWLKAKETLGARLEKIYALVLSNDKVSRDNFNALVKKLRPQFPNSWFVFNANQKLYPRLNPIDDLKIIYVGTFTKPETSNNIKKFRNMTPAPIMAFGSSKMVNTFEGLGVSWIISSLPKNLKRNIAKISRPMHKGGTAEEQMQSLIKTFKKNRKQGTLEFAFATDTHYHSSEKITPASRTPEHMREMAKVAKELKLDFVANGGDMVNGARPREENIKDMREVIEAMATSGLPVFATIGNHDDGVFWVLKKFKKSDISLIATGEDWHNTCVKDVALGKGAIGDKNFEKANYFYMDFPESKIRFINTCVSENPMTIGKDGKFVIDSCGLYDISARQLDWLITQALNFSDKPDAKEWSVVLLSHTILNGGMPNGNLIMGVFKAFINGEKFQGKSKKGVPFPANIACDFSKQGPIPILMNIAGHKHTDNISYSPLGYLNVITLNDRTTNKTIERKIGTPSESSWSLVTIDRQKGEATILRYGAGVDMQAPLFNPNLKKKN